MIVIALNVILAMLLGAALFVGLRLDKRLKTLREDQGRFEGAVAELNAAVLRADGGLNALKQATAEAHTVLADRLQDAKGAVAKLEKNMLAAKDVSDRLEHLQSIPIRMPEPRPAPPPAMDLPPLRPAALSTPRAPVRHEPRHDIREEPLALSRPIDARSRARIDDDLFDAPEPRRAAGAYR